MIRRLVLVAVALLAFGVPANAAAALFFLFNRPTAAPNDEITVRTGGTPVGFALSQRVRPLQRSVRVYLVRSDLATRVRSRLDPRLSFVGSIVPDKNGRGVLTFSVPPLDAGSYTIASWCPACARYSGGRTFFVQRPSQFVPRYRAQARLRIAKTTSCPVTLPNGDRPPGQPRDVPWYGNGLLWAGLESDGVYIPTPDNVAPDGSIGTKLLWVTFGPSWPRPTISGERIDAPAPSLRVYGVNEGSFQKASNPSFMTPVTFPTPGCWRLRARVGDLSLSRHLQPCGLHRRWRLSLPLGGR